MARDKNFFICRMLLSTSLIIVRLMITDVKS